MSSHIYLRINALFVFLFIAVITAIATIFCLPTSAFAVTSVKHGWMALDSNKKPVLNGSQYVLSSGTAQPVQFITDAKTVKAVPAKSVVYLNNKKAGKATALIVGDKIPGFKDAFITTFTVINTIDIAKASIANIANQTYTGGKISPGITVKYGNQTLKKDKDYKVSYGANTNVGKGSVTIKGVGSYSGSKTANFNIVKANLSKASIANIANQTYTGGKISPGVTVKYGKTTLKKDKDYKVSYGANTNVGKGSVTISGIGGYTGSATKNFNIVKADLGKASIDAIQARYADGFTRVTPPVTVRLNGRVLRQNVDYYVEYGANTQPGQGSVVVRAKNGNFSGSKGATFNLVNLGDELARKSCSLAFSKDRYGKGGAGKRTKAYIKAWKANGKPHAGDLGRSCDAAVCVSVRATNFDKKYPGGQQSQVNYLHNSSKNTRWKKIGKAKLSKSSKVKSILALMYPGDVVHIDNGSAHTFIYVGKAIPQEIYNSTLRNTDADRGKPKGDFVSAYHGGAYGPGITEKSGYNYVKDYSGEIEIWRCVKPQNGKKAGSPV